MAGDDGELISIVNFNTLIIWTIKSLWLRLCHVDAHDGNIKAMAKTIITTTISATGQVRGFRKT